MYLTFTVQALMLAFTPYTLYMDYLIVFIVVVIFEHTNFLPDSYNSILSYLILSYNETR